MEGGDDTVYVWHKPTELSQSFSFCSRTYFCLYGPSTVFHSINPPDNSPFSDCSSCLISALLVFPTLQLFVKVFFSPDMIHSGWMGSKHQLTNKQTKLAWKSVHSLIIIIISSINENKRCWAFQWYTNFAVYSFGNLNRPLYVKFRLLSARLLGLPGPLADTLPEADPRGRRSSVEIVNRSEVSF